MSTVASVVHGGRDIAGGEVVTDGRLGLLVRLVPDGRQAVQPRRPRGFEALEAAAEQVGEQVVIAESLVAVVEGADEEVLQG